MNSYSVRFGRDMLVETRVRRHLAALESDGLFRAVRPPAGIDLSSNDYLGLARDPYVEAGMADGIRKEGCGSTGSRLLRGERSALSTLEKRFAAFKGTESALYFSSGYMANLAILSTFPQRGDRVISDRLNHASLKDGIRLGLAQKVVLPHIDLRAVRRTLQSGKMNSQQFLVTESLYSMDGDFAPLAEYATICRETGAALIVDEAHATGIYGKGGRGLIEAAGIGSEVFLSINTAGKALGVGGAFVAGPAWAVEYLVQRARPFIFTTAPPPSMAGALNAALDVIEREPERRERVLFLSGFLRGLLADAGLTVGTEGSHIIPVPIGDNRRAIEIAGALQARGFDVRAIRPPTVPEGTARLRISINVSLTESDLCRFAFALTEEMRSRQ